jgi:predicted aspartyl protease
LAHVYAKARVIGTKTHHVLDNLLVDTGATFTVLPSDLLEEVGALRVPTKTKLELGDGRSVEAEVYAIVLAIEDREGATLAVTFAGAKPVLGVRSLEDLGLKVDPVSGSLEAARPPGIAYYYSTIFNGGPGGIRTRDLPVSWSLYLANRTFFGPIHGHTRLNYRP